MLIFLVIGILILTVSLMLALRLLRPGFGYHWLVVSVGTTLAWILVLVLGFLLPIRAQIGSWMPGLQFANSIILNLDQISWPFAFGLTTISLAIIYTDVVRARELDWSNWASTLIYTGLGFIAVLSGNLLTFLLTWTLFDFIGFSILMTQIYSNATRRRIVVILFSRLFGTMGLYLAGVLSVSNQTGFTLEQVTPLVLVLIVASAMLRIMILPGEDPVFRRSARRRSMGTVSRMTSAGIVFVLLARLGMENEFLVGNNTIINLIIFVVGLMAILSAIAWWLAKDELEGRQAWVAGMSALVIASTLRGDGEASLAWGLAALFSGGLIFIASVRERFSLWIALLGLIGLSAFPFTPAWNGLNIFDFPINPYLLLFFISIVLILIGYVRHASQRRDYPVGIERWIKVFYPIGLLILPVAHFGAGWFVNTRSGAMPLVGWLLGPLICVLASVGFFWQYRGGRVPHFIMKWSNSLFALNWLFAITSLGYRLFSRFINFVTVVLEGEGGFLWALLWIVLFLSILVISLGFST
jgi:hypothetical protein